MLVGNAAEAIQAAEVVFQRKSSAHEANNLIPFEALSLKVFDPYSGIYFIDGLHIIQPPFTAFAGFHSIKAAISTASHLTMFIKSAGFISIWHPTFPALTNIE